MIRAAFKKDFSGFTVSGHSGYAEAGSDIVCAAVSSMTFLVCNAIEAFGCDAEVGQDEKTASVSLTLRVPDENGSRLIAVLYDELRELEDQYPAFVRVQKI